MEEKIAQLFGRVNPPPGVAAYSGTTAEQLTTFLGIIVRSLIVIAGIYALFNLVLAGYAFMSAGDNPKAIEGAWAKIWQTLLGLAFTAGAFILAAIFGKLVFNDFFALLRIRIYGP
ncbi:hypothetical protein HY008_00385 [Candidatus Woesebacteria bacterium]|nr:hypothetical protein [Candidatus Woesebacteria bacterium]